DVGAVVDGVGRNVVPASVPGQKRYPAARVLRQKEAVAGRVIGRFEGDFLDVVEQRIESAAAENADVGGGLFRQSHLWKVFFLRSEDSRPPAPTSGGGEVFMRQGAPRACRPGVKINADLLYPASHAFFRCCGRLRKQV